MHQLRMEPSPRRIQVAFLELKAEACEICEYQMGTQYWLALRVASSRNCVVIFRVEIRTLCSNQKGLQGWCLMSMMLLSACVYVPELKDTHYVWRRPRN